VRQSASPGHASAREFQIKLTAIFTVLVLVVSGRKEIQKIDLPRNWDKLVAKYKNVVPTFAKY